ncbi:hypothetical protein OH77DRAFT_1522283 [Trametes cingulata]|nr:hypothetical protein OH77DRAFT_1522283 [Trametes cingulata]
MSASSLAPLLAGLGGSLPSLDNSYGAVLLGTFFGLILYGLALHQAYRYSRMDFGDSKWMKCYVAIVMALDTFHVILCMHMCYYYLVDNYFDPAVLFTRVWSIDNLGLSAAVTIVTCQGFYAHRVWLVGRQYRPLVIIVVVFLLGVLGMFKDVLIIHGWTYSRSSHAPPHSSCSASATYATVNANILPGYSEFRQLTWLFSIGFGLVVVSDVIMTTVLIVVLRRSRTGFTRQDRTDSKLDVLIAYTISTGLLTDVFSILSFIFPLAYLGTNSMVYIALDIVTTKFYVNSVIGTLNFRKTLAMYGSNPGSNNHEIGLSVLPRSAGGNSAPHFFNSQTSAGTVIDIKVTSELTQDVTASVTNVSHKEYGTDIRA